MNNFRKQIRHEITKWAFEIRTHSDAESLIGRLNDILQEAQRAAFVEGCDFEGQIDHTLDMGEYQNYLEKELKRRFE